MVTNIGTGVDGRREPVSVRDSQPTLDAVWDALGRLPDPEVPAVSIVELGIVRGVEWTGKTLHVRVTPTYSGCPATETIRDAIRRTLEDLHVREFAIDIVLAPPWTTDWMAPEAKAKLRAFGIAPPGARVAGSDVIGIVRRRRGADVACPRCGSNATSLVAQFGSTACKALYRCDSCREPFDYFKPF